MSKELREKIEAWNEQKAAFYLGVSESTLRNWRCQRRYGLPYYKVGGKVRYKRKNLDEWYESRAVNQVEKTA